MEIHSLSFTIRDSVVQFILTLKDFRKKIAQKNKIFVLALFTSQKH